MMRNIWKYARVVMALVVVACLATTGSAHAKRGGVGKSVDGSEVEDGSLTGVDVADGSLKGVDIDESTLTCTGPNGIPGCGATTGTPAAPTVTQGPAGTAPLGYPAIQQAVASSTCPQGTTVIGGSVRFEDARTNDNQFIRESFASGNAWFAIAIDAGPNKNHGVTLHVNAICLG